MTPGMIPLTPPPSILRIVTRFPCDGGWILKDDDDDAVLSITNMLKFGDKIFVEKEYVW